MTLEELLKDLNNTDLTQILYDWLNESENMTEQEIIDEFIHHYDLIKNEKEFYLNDLEDQK